MLRSTLLHALQAVQGAASPKATAPAFSSVFFDGKTATAYDGELAIITPFKAKLSGGMDHKTLLTWANGCSGEEVSIEQTGDGDEVTFKCGRSRIKSTLLEPEQLTFEPPMGSGVELREIEELVASVKRVSAFMGNDPAHPARQGITVSSFREEAITLYATDDLSMTTDTVLVAVDGDIEAVLPARFVKALVAFGSEVSAIEFGDGWVTATAENEDGATILFSRTGTEVDVKAYAEIVESSMRAVGDVEDASKVTESLLKTIKSVTATLTAMAQAEVQITIEDGRLRLSSGPGSTKVDESVKTDHGTRSGWIVAKEMLRALEGATAFKMTDEAFVAVGDGFLNLVAMSAAE